ncbi:hypothetical protein BOX15_Mlig027305g1, partial [Macrostomum lignano]
TTERQLKGLFYILDEIKALCIVMETRHRKAASPQRRRDTSRSRSRISRPSLPASAAAGSSLAGRGGRRHGFAGGRNSLAGGVPRHLRYDPSIELRQVKERIPMYTDWAKQDELFETTRLDRQRYEAKQAQKRLSQSLNSSVGGNLNSSLNSNASDGSCFEMEDDEAVLLRRQRDIDKSKNLTAYANYVKSVPKPLREKGDPRTPNKFVRMSRRAWDGCVKQWKLQLHRWDDAASSSAGISPRSSPSSTPPPPPAKLPADDEDGDSRTLTAVPAATSSVQPDALHSGLTSDVQGLAVGAACPRLTRKRSSALTDSPSKKLKH